MRISPLHVSLLTAGVAMAAAALESCSSTNQGTNGSTEMDASANPDGASGFDARGAETSSDAGSPNADGSPATDAGSTGDAGGAGEGSAGRSACMFGPGALPSQTLDPGMPTGSAIPIDTVVVVMMENHSFDSYFAHLNQYAHRTDIESAPDTATNVDSTGKAQPFTHAQHLCTLDTNHEWPGTHQEIDQGKMDGFARANDGYNKTQLPPTSTDPALWSGGRAMLWYDQRDIPFYYSLASTFAIADHYHSSVPGPTWPNRMYLYAATSFGETTNTRPDLSAYPYPTKDATILDQLEKNKTSWMLYSDGPPAANLVYGADLLTRWNRVVVAPYSQFKAQAAAGQLPSVSFVDPVLASEVSGATSADEHPPGDIQIGQQFVSDVAQAVMSSPQWAHVALFVVHDEHGGFYDHVPPPHACPPDSKAPILAPGDTTAGGFDIAGVRVALIAVSPYAKKAYVGHHVYDHTSITRFLQTRFTLPALTARDANAEPPMDLFDFSTVSFATPPSIAAAPAVDPTELLYCEKTYGTAMSLGDGSAPEGSTASDASGADALSDAAALDAAGQ